MDKLMRLSPTGIEYGDYAWNFASGCGNNIDGKCKAGGFRCWAYSITQRFDDRYPNGFKPTIYPEALRNSIFERDGFKCIKCGSTVDLQIDHIIPFSRGGQTTEDNLQTLCLKCNILKGIK